MYNQLNFRVRSRDISLGLPYSPSMLPPSTTAAPMRAIPLAEQCALPEGVSPMRMMDRLNIGMNLFGVTLSKSRVKKTVLYSFNCTMISDNIRHIKGSLKLESTNRSIFTVTFYDWWPVRRGRGPLPPESHHDPVEVQRARLDPPTQRGGHHRLDRHATNLKADDKSNFTL